MSDIEADLPPASSGDLSTRYSIRAVDRAFDILDLLARAEDGASLIDISASIGLPKSSVFRYLSTLERRGHVIRDSEEVFRLGAGRSFMRPRDVARLGGAAVSRMQELCRRFDETINLGTLDAHRIVYLEVVESPKAMRFAAARGGSDPIHSSALGKAIAATLGDNEVRGMLSVEGMKKMTSRTITTPDAYLKELSEVRNQGYSVDDGENEEGGRCVAVPLPYPPHAALSLSAPEARLPREQLPEVAATLRRAAEDIALEVRSAGA